MQINFQKFSNITSLLRISESGEKRWTCIVIILDFLFVWGFRLTPYARHLWPLSREDSLAPHLLWHKTSVYNDHLRGPVTPTLFDFGAVSTRLNDLGLSRLGFEQPIFRFRGACSNPLRHRRGCILEGVTSIVNIGRFKLFPKRSRVVFTSKSKRCTLIYYSVSRDRTLILVLKTIMKYPVPPKVLPAQRTQSTW